MYYDNLKQAKTEAKNILNNTSEISIAIENLKSKKLFLLYRTKTDVLKNYKEAEAKNKIEFKSIIKNNDCYTIEKTKSGIKAFIYF